MKNRKFFKVLVNCNSRPRSKSGAIGSFAKLLGYKTGGFA